jgi:transcriptional regulator with XRE-family HTH domain
MIAGFFCRTGVLSTPPGAIIGLTHYQKKAVRYPGIRTTTMIRKASSEAIRRKEMREFLVAHRAAISPEAVGLPRGTRRRTPGLRREELATLAGVGVTWYTWLEQGRDIRPSAPTLERICRALRLTPIDTTYLFALAGVARSSAEGSTTAGVEPYWQSLLDDFDAGPAFLTNFCFDTVAFNLLAETVFQFPRSPGLYGRNMVWRMFMLPESRTLFRDWEMLCQRLAGILRFWHAKAVGNAYFEGLVRELRTGSAEFSRLWEAQLIVSPKPACIRMRHPQLEDLSFTSLRLRTVNSDEQFLQLFQPTDARTATVMQRLLAGTKSSRSRVASAARKTRRTNEAAQS